MKNIFSISFLITILYIFTGCDKREVSVENLHHDYFPVNIGHWVIYDVNSIVYDDFTGEVDTSYYQLKEVIHSKFTDESGNEAVRLERFMRQDENDVWSVKNVWTARRLPSRAEKAEENQRYIKLAFPPKLNKTWDGNAYNTKDDKIYRITDVHKAEKINETEFDSVVTVLQSETQTLISEEYKVEKYAKNVGLVYKEFVDFEKEIDGTVISGVDYSYSFVEHGVDEVN